MDNVTKVFSKRLKQLRGNKSQDDVAKDIGISRGALSYYEKGERNPDINILSSIAKYYNVSADYLLGLSDTPTLSVEEKAICDTIGLSKNSVDILKIHAQRARQTPVKDDESEDDWELIMWSYLSLQAFDSKFHISYSNDYDFLSDAIFFRIQRTFLSIRKEFLQKLYKELQAYDTENEEYSQEIIYSTIRSLLDPLMKNLSHR